MDFREFKFDCSSTQLHDLQREGTDTGGSFLQQVSSDIDEEGKQSSENFALLCEKMASGFHVKRTPFKEPFTVNS